MSSGSSRSMREARTPCTESGSSTDSMPGEARQRSSSRTTIPPSMRRRRISSRKNGLPSARSRMRTCSEWGRSSIVSSRWTSCSASPGASGSRDTATALRQPAAPARSRRDEVGAGRIDEQQRADASARRAPRGGRAVLGPPSGCPRRPAPRGRASASAPRKVRQAWWTCRRASCGSSRRAGPPGPRRRRCRPGSRRGPAVPPGSAMSRSMTSRDLVPRLGHGVGVLDAGVVLEHLGERPVGHAVAVRQAPSPQHQRGRVAVLHAVEELAHQPALADAGVTEDRDDVRPCLLDRACVRAPQDVELGVAADHRRARGTGLRGSARRSHLRGGTHVPAPVCPAGPAHPAPRRRTRGAAWAVRSATSVSPGLRRGLQSRGHDDRLAGDHRVARRRARRREDLAGVDADPDLQRHVVRPAEVVVDVLEPCAAWRAPRAAHGTGSSSWAFGTPNTAITASPMNFSTVPPSASISARMASK